MSAASSSSASPSTDSSTYTPLLERLREVSQQQDISEHDKIKKYWDLAQTATTKLLRRTGKEPDADYIYTRICYLTALNTLVDTVNNFRELLHSTYFRKLVPSTLSKDRHKTTEQYTCTCTRQPDKKHLACQILDLVKQKNLHTIANLYADAASTLLCGKDVSRRFQAKYIVLISVIKQIFDQTIKLPSEVEIELQSGRYHPFL